MVNLNTRSLQKKKKQKKNHTIQLSEGYTADFFYI